DGIHGAGGVCVESILNGVRRPFPAALVGISNVIITVGRPGQVTDPCFASRVDGDRTGLPTAVDRRVRPPPRPAPFGVEETPTPVIAHARILGRIHSHGRPETVPDLLAPPNAHANG